MLEGLCEVYNNFVHEILTRALRYNDEGKDEFTIKQTSGSGSIDFYGNVKNTSKSKIYFYPVAPFQELFCWCVKLILRNCEAFFHFKMDVQIEQPHVD